jgi:hypothetical protein
LRYGRLAAQQAQLHIRESLKFGVDTGTLYTMLVGAKELDLLALKYLYAGEIVQFYKQFEKGKSENDEENMNFYRLMQEIVAPVSLQNFLYHERYSGGKRNVPKSLSIRI